MNSQIYLSHGNCTLDVLNIDGDGYIGCRSLNCIRYERLLLISGLDCEFIAIRGIKVIKLYNMHDFDKYVKVLATYNNIPLETIKYNRKRVNEVFNNEND